MWARKDTRTTCSIMHVYCEVTLAQGDSANVIPCHLFPSSQFSTQSALEDVFVHNSFEETVELANSFSYCVALYDYIKVNPNDMPLE